MQKPQPVRRLERIVWKLLRTKMSRWPSVAARLLSWARPGPSGSAALWSPGLEHGGLTAQRAAAGVRSGVDPALAMCAFKSEPRPPPPLFFFWPGKAVEIDPGGLLV